MYQGSSSGLLVSFCPGPGNGWGNLTVPPASKEAVSPSKPILYSVFCRGGKNYKLHPDFRTYSEIFILTTVKTTSYISIFRTYTGF